MRIVLSTLAVLMITGSAFAAEPYTPPKVYISRPDLVPGQDDKIATEAYLAAQAVCLAVESDPGDRDRYYIRCMKDELGSRGFTVMSQKEYEAAKLATSA